MNLQPAIFLDRDGTLMEEAGYCARPAQVRVLPGVVEALEKLRSAGYLLIVVTNQSGIGRGYFDEAAYRGVQAEFERQILPARLDAVYYCPDAPGAPSDCRKPAPGMLLEAARACGVDLTRSWMIGDKASDIECGRAAGCRTILVLTGYGRDQTNAAADFVADSLSEAVTQIVAERCPECRAPNCSRLRDLLFARDFEQPALYWQHHRLAIDAYSVQHSAYVESSKSLAAHLCGLCIAIEHSGNPAMLKRLQLWLSTNPKLPMPALPASRGKFTIADISEIADPAAYGLAVKAWAQSVWDAYSQLQPIAREWLALSAIRSA